MLFNLVADCFLVCLQCPAAAQALVQYVEWMVDHHLQQCRGLERFKFNPGSNIPGETPSHDKLCNYGGLREVMPLVETLLNLLKADKSPSGRLTTWTSRSLPSHVLWEGGKPVKTPEVLEKLRIR